MKAATAPLDRFAFEYPGIAARLVARAEIAPTGFGQALWQYLDVCVRRGITGQDLRTSTEALHQIHQDSTIRNAFEADLRAAAQKLTAGREVDGKLRSLWGTTPLINLIPCAKAERLNGIDAETVVWTTYYIENRFDIVLKDQFDWMQRWCPSLVETYSNLVFAWALLSFDIFYYFNDRGLVYPVGGYGSSRFGINPNEMRCLRESGKHLFTLTYGADNRTRARTLASGRFNFCMHCPEPGKFCICDDDGARQMFDVIHKHATRTLAWGLSLDYLPAPRRLSYLVVDTAALVPAATNTAPQLPLRVLHSPNHAFFKGSHYLEQAIARLKAEGVAIEYRTLTGASNQQVLASMRDAHVVADQFIGGCYGYTAVEAMALGKPVLCYLRDRALTASAEECPIIEADPDSVYDVLRAITEDMGRLVDLGKRSRAYVERHHSVNNLAKQLAELHQDCGPPTASRWRGTFRERIGRGVGSLLRWLRRMTRALLNKALDAAAIDPVTGSSKAPLAAWLVAAARVAYHCARRVLRLLRLPIFARVLPLFAKTLLQLATYLGRIATTVRFALGRPRAVWGTTPILTLPKLVRCDRRIGVDARSLVHTTYYITQDFDRNLERWREKIMTHCPWFYDTFWRLVLCVAMLRFDVFHFFCDRGILPSAQRMGINEEELRILRAAGKRIYTYTYGADVRTRETTQTLGPINFCMDCPDPGRCCICDEAAGRNNIKTIRDHATAMNAMGDMLLYVPAAREFHFWPLDTSQIPDIGVCRDSDGPLRVGHAPNHPHFKGTRHLEHAVAALADQGIQVELVRVEGVPNAQVLEMLSTIDVLAEQFIGGFHGYTALEAMALGKPVICYIGRREWLADPQRCPIIEATPDSLQETLTWCAHHRGALVELGRQARNYVERNYSLDAVAVGLARMYVETADFPPRLSASMKQRADQLEATLPQPLTRSDAFAEVALPAREEAKR